MITNFQLTTVLQAINLLAVGNEKDIINHRLLSITQELYVDVRPSHMILIQVPEKLFISHDKRNCFVSLKMKEFFNEFFSYTSAAMTIITKHFLSLAILAISFSIASAAFGSYGQHQLQSRIVGGSAVKRGQFPYQVSLRSKRKGQHFCGGAIISNFYILSAAHCLMGLRRADNIFVVVGAHKLTGDGNAIDILHATSHPLFNSTDEQWHNDIALLRTKQEIIFNEFVQPIDLPAADFPFDKPESEMKAIITGWGFLKVHAFN